MTTTFDFIATHKIVTPSESVLVLLDDGVCYTREEWEACARADWEFTAEDGLLFQGRVIDGAGIYPLVQS